MAAVLQIGPVPSSRLLHNVEKAEASLRLLLWRIAATLFDAQDTLAALENCRGKQSLARDALLGQNLAYWAEAPSFAGLLVAMQHTLCPVHG